MVGVKPRLLVVDDNEDNRYTLNLLLEIEGYSELSMAEDGEAALKALRSERFDLVLLDVMMPRLNGIQVLEQLKAEDRIGDPPIIMVSALDELESTVRCIELGAVDYLPKPFEPVLLKAKVRATLERKALLDEVKAHRDRMEDELQEARALQIGLCPQTFPPPSPDRPVDIHGRMTAAREVGGDFFDFFDRDDGTLCLVVGDVAGKGAPAALFMARSRDLVRIAGAELRGPEGALMDAGEIVGQVNATLGAANASFTFVTLLVALLEPRSGRLRFCNAGHDDPYLLSRSGNIEPLTSRKGPPAGIRPAHRYSTEERLLERGETLFLYSDGVTEALNEAGELYGPARLMALLQAQAGSGSRTIVEAVSDSVDRFAGVAPQADDITLMAVTLVQPSR